MEYSIDEIAGDKKRYLELLLIGDESEPMIDRYLDSADLYILFISGVAAGCCAMTSESPSLVEIRNLAVMPDYRRRGFGHALLRFVEQRYDGCDIRLGTGATPSTLRFYESAGYRYSHRIPDFFTDNYDHPIIEEGVLLQDMLYLTKTREAFGK